VTTAEEVQWWYRDRLLALGLDPWFHPSVAIQRQGAKGMIEGAEVISIITNCIGSRSLPTDVSNCCPILPPNLAGRSREMGAPPVSAPGRISRTV
jgi:hypothetical protein